MNNYSTASCPKHSALGSNAVGEREPKIKDRLNIAEKLTEELQQALQALDRRLQCISNMEPPRDNVKDGPKPVHGIELVDRLEDLNARLSAMGSAVVSMLSRLEV